MLTRCKSYVCSWTQPLYATVINSLGMLRPKFYSSAINTDTDIVWLWLIRVLRVQIVLLCWLFISKIFSTKKTPIDGCKRTSSELIKQLCLETKLQ